MKVQSTSGNLFEEVLELKSENEKLKRRWKKLKEGINKLYYHGSGADAIYEIEELIDNLEKE